MSESLINPFVWIDGRPPVGWSPGLEQFWVMVAEGALVSVALGLIGCFLVVRGMSLLGDALSHSVLPGIVIGFLIGRSLQSVWILVGATAMGMVASMLVQAVQHHSRVKEDASLGVVFTALFALGVVLINLYAGQSDLDPGCVLYGQLEAFTPGRWRELLPMALILSGIVLMLVLFYRHIVASTFDPLLARSVGIPATLIHYLMMAVLSLTTVASFEAVGAVLVVALLVMPGATARLWTDRMPRMLWLAAGHAVLSTILGYWLAHPANLDTSAGAAISVAGFGLFAVSWMLAPRQGLISQWRVRHRLRMRMAEENIIKAVHELTSGTGAAPAIARTELAMLLKLSEAGVYRAARRAASRGWAKLQGEQVALTAAGHQRAETLAHAHELWEQYLQKEVGVATDHLHDPAEWVEHFLTDDRIEALRETVGQKHVVEENRRMDAGV